MKTVANCGVLTAWFLCISILGAPKYVFSALWLHNHHHQRHHHHDGYGDEDHDYDTQDDGLTMATTTTISTAMRRDAPQTL